MKIKPTKRDKSLVLTLSTDEMGALQKLSDKRGVTKSAVLRQSLRLYESLDARIAAGNRLVLEAPHTNEKSELLLL
jgi:Ribbon-helix-helix protein, copG family